MMGLNGMFYVRVFLDCLQVRQTAEYVSVETYNTEDFAARLLKKKMCVIICGLT